MTLLSVFESVVFYYCKSVGVTENLCLWLHCSNAQDRTGARVRACQQEMNSQFLKRTLAPEPSDILMGLLPLQQ